MQAKMRTEFTDTPLVDAAAYGRAADVVALLADGADVNERNSTFGMTALWIACQNGHMTERRGRRLERRRGDLCVR